MDSPLDNYKRVATAEQIVEIIHRVHEIELLHLGIHKTRSKVSMILFLVLAVLRLFRIRYSTRYLIN